MSLSPDYHRSEAIALMILALKARDPAIAKDLLQIAAHRIARADDAERIFSLANKERETEPAIVTRNHGSTLGSHQSSVAPNILEWLPYNALKVAL